MAYQNGLLRANGDELMTLAEHRRCIEEDRDELAELKNALAAAMAEVERLKNNLM